MEAYEEKGEGQYEQKLKAYIESQEIKARHLHFENSCHSVAEAAAAVGCQAEEIVKNICLLDDQGALIVAIVKGEDRVSTKRVAQVLGTGPLRSALPEEILAKTGYPCGGVPSFGYQGIFLIDSKVMEQERVYTGGGSPHSLVNLATQSLLAANRGQVARIRK